MPVQSEPGFPDRAQKGEISAIIRYARIRTENPVKKRVVAICVKRIIYYKQDIAAIPQNNLGVREDGVTVYRD